MSFTFNLNVLFYAATVLFTWVAAYFLFGLVLEGVYFGLSREHGSPVMLLYAAIALLIMILVSGGPCYYLLRVAHQPVWGALGIFSILVGCAMKLIRLYHSD